MARAEVSASASSVLCVGEAILDVAVDGEREVSHPGGSPFNVAIALSRLGCAVTLRTSLGEDAAGDRMRAHAAAAGVVLDPLSHVAKRTSRSTVRLDAARDAMYEFDFRWSVSPQVPVEAFDIVHTGSIAHTTAPGADALLELMRGMKGVAVRSFDPNSRPGLSGSPAEGREAFWRFATEADIVKLSADDAAWLFPGRDRTAVVDAIAARIDGLVVMTLGADGAILRSGAESVRVPGVVVDVIDTVGAGDAFMAALLHLLGPSLRRGVRACEVPGDQLAGVGALAVAYASLSAARAGANPLTAAEFRDFWADDVSVMRR